MTTSKNQLETTLEIGFLFQNEFEKLVGQKLYRTFFRRVSIQKSRTLQEI